MHAMTHPTTSDEHMPLRAMSTLPVRGITMAFDEHGEGPDVVLLVHGHPFDRTMW